MNQDLDNIDIRELTIRYRSKREMYQQLTVHGNYYSSCEADTDNNSIADIIQGRKR